MATVTPKGDCLVARAIPIDECAEQLSGLLDKLSVDDAAARRNNKFEAMNSVSPSDYVTLQTIRSSALARKTNTTSKFSRGGPTLFAELLNSNTPKKDEEEDEEQKLAAAEKAKIKAKAVKVVKIEEKKPKEVKTEEKKENKPEQKDEEKQDEENEGELLSRGPVRNVRPSANQHQYGYLPYGTAAQTTINDLSGISGYNNGYECGSTWSFSPDTIGSISASTTPDTVFSSDGYGSASPMQNSPKTNQQSPYSDTSSDISRVSPQKNNELPENLQDFILQYSNQYTKEDTRGRPPSADSGVSSPMSARSAPYASPHIPQGTCSGPTTPSFLQTNLSPRLNDTRISAKQRLHALITESELATGFHWACTTWQTMRSNRDADGDTPLHIVVAHNDRGKIYALCETMRKTKTDDENVFSIANNFGESPLYVAVLQRSVQVVDYLIELGASPNSHSTRADRDTALHHASSRGMTEIVEILTSHREIRFDDVNDHGETALLCAVKMHGMVDEHTQKPIDNKAIIGHLIKVGADPNVAETSTGKNIVHYAIDKMDVELLDLLKTHINEDLFTEIANSTDLNGENAVDLLIRQSENDAENIVRQDIYIVLLAAGAVRSDSE